MFEEQKQFPQVALEKVLFEEGFLGGAVGEPPAVGVAAEVDGVDVEKAVVLDSQGDFEGFEAVVFFEAGDAVAAEVGGGAESRLVVFPFPFQRGGNR